MSPDLTVRLAADAAGSIFDSLNRDDQSVWKARASLYLEGLPATIFVSAVTFVALFLEDLRLAVFPPAADVACQVLSGIVLVRLLPTLNMSLVNVGQIHLQLWVDCLEACAWGAPHCDHLACQAPVR